MIILGIFAYALVAGGVVAKLDRWGKSTAAPLADWKLFILGLLWPALLLFSAGVKIGGMTE